VGLAPVDLPDIAPLYGTTQVDAENNGHTVVFRTNPGSVVQLGAEQFELLQFHFHAHSEHSIGGVFFPLEMHLVHRSVLDPDKLLVLGVLIAEGVATPTFENADWQQLPRRQGERLVDASTFLDLASLLPGGVTYRYDGSLTTPPCTESVQWVVYATPMTFSAQQIRAFSNIYDRDWRPTTELNMRAITYGE
jgi:carbonic anhydrase